MTLYRLCTTVPRRHLFFSSCDQVQLQVQGIGSRCVLPAGSCVIRKPTWLSFSTSHGGNVRTSTTWRLLQRNVVLGRIPRKLQNNCWFDRSSFTFSETTGTDYLQRKGKEMETSNFPSSQNQDNGKNCSEDTRELSHDQKTHTTKVAKDADGYMPIDEVVAFLQREGAMDLCLIETSGSRKSYVDYFIVVSGASTRHLRAMAKNLEYQFRGHEVRGVGRSGHVTVEGLDSDHWMVLDIGNAVVHFFLPEVRELYELEKLWTLGPRYDDQYRAMLEEDEQLNAVFLGRTPNEQNEF